MATRKAFMAGSIKVSIPAPDELPALGRLATEYDEALAPFVAWVKARGGTVEMKAPKTVTREVEDDPVDGPVSDTQRSAA